MPTPPPANTLRAAFRHLTAETARPFLHLAIKTARSARHGVSEFAVPLALTALFAVTVVLLSLTGIAAQLGRFLTPNASLAIAAAVLVIGFAGALARRPEAFPHEQTWKRAKAAFVILTTIVFTGCCVAFFAAHTVSVPATG